MTLFVVKNQYNQVLALFVRESEAKEFQNMNAKSGIIKTYIIEEAWAKL